MKTALIIRNAISPAEVPPATFDIDAFADRLGLGSAEQQIRVPQFSLSEWRHARLQILPDRLQLGFKETADGELVERVLADFIAQVEALAPQAALGLNAILRLDLEEGDGDPSAAVFDAKEFGEKLGGSEGRGGITLVFKDEVSRWWMELSPVPDEDRVWTFDVNRNFATFPADPDARLAIFGWFKEIEKELLAQFDLLFGVEESHR